MDKKTELTNYKLYTFIDCLEQMRHFEQREKLYTKFIKILCKQPEKIDENVEQLLSSALTSYQLNELFIYAAQQGELAFIKSLYDGRATS